MTQYQFKKGALVQVLPSGAQKRIVAFQYNPELLKRTQNLGADENVVNESIRFTLVFNAAEDLERDDELAKEHGVYPKIAALEELFAEQNEQVASSGGTWGGLIGGSSQLPVILFKWGHRTVPVRIQRLVIMEQLFDTELNPVHAAVDVQLRVLTRKDLKNHAKGRQILVAYKAQRQVF